VLVIVVNPRSIGVGSRLCRGGFALPITEIIESEGRRVLWAAGIVGISRVEAGCHQSLVTTLCVVTRDDAAVRTK
jgi:hypothetical protein